MIMIIRWEIQLDYCSGRHKGNWNGEREQKRNEAVEMSKLTDLLWGPEKVGRRLP